MSNLSNMSLNARIHLSPSAQQGTSGVSRGTEESERIRKEIERQTAEFIAKGGVIEEIPFGESGLDSETGIPKGRLKDLERYGKNAVQAYRGYTKGSALNEAKEKG